MSGLYLYDDARARHFEPFALTRPISELMAGVGLLRDRWVVALQLPAVGFISAPHLARFEEGTAPAAVRGRIPAGAVVANSRFAPKLRGSLLDASFTDPVARVADRPAPADLWTSRGRTAAVRLTRELDASDFDAGVLDLDALVSKQQGNGRVVELDGWWIDEVWDFIRLLNTMLSDDIPYLYRAPLEQGRISTAPPPHATVIGDAPVLVAPDLVTGGSMLRRGATIEPYVVLDASAGPIYIGPESVVHSFTRIVGPCYIGRGSTVLGDRVAACSIGDLCKVRGEISMSVMLGHANKGHDGFVGHSYLGRWVNLGASTVTSNLKNTYGSVQLWTPAGLRDTGMQFLGTLFGDHVKTGIGLRLTTGTVLGAGANVYGTRMPPKVVPPFAWGDHPPYDTYAVEKFLEVAERMMQRRHVTLTDGMRAQLTTCHSSRWILEAGA